MPARYLRPRDWMSLASSIRAELDRSPAHGQSPTAAAPSGTEVPSSSTRAEPDHHLQPGTAVPVRVGGPYPPATADPGTSPRLAPRADPDSAGSRSESPSHRWRSDPGQAHAARLSPPTLPSPPRWLSSSGRWGQVPWSCFKPQAPRAGTHRDRGSAPGEHHMIGTTALKDKVTAVV